MKNKVKFLVCMPLILILSFSLVSAISISSINADNFQPGSDQSVSIKMKNTLSDDANDVSLILNIPSTSPFTILSSDNSVDSINSDDTETFSFDLKSSNDAKAGDYPISYTLAYKIGNSTTVTTETGTFSLTIEANPELSYSISADNPVVGTQGKIKITVINKGLGDAKFVNVKIIPEGYTLLSDENNYIGTISSDDSQTSSFDAIFNNQDPTITFQVEYKDFNNKDNTKTINLPLTVYSKEEALKLGIITANNSFLYIVLVILAIAAWIIIGRIRKKKRLNKAQGR